ncbi:MAG: nucleotidyltransferase family protein [Pararhodobacter sp.]
MHVALLAAGAARRMGPRDKLLEEIDGQPLLRRLAVFALEAGIGPVAVTLPPEGDARSLPRRIALEGLALTPLTVADAASGMSASLRAAARWATGHALMLVPADMPEIGIDELRAMARAYEGAPLRATAEDGRPGHPVVFPPDLLPDFAGLSGDDGARALLRRHPPRLIPLAAERAIIDLDTPEDWRRWRAARG